MKFIFGLCIFFLTTIAHSESNELVPKFIGYQRVGDFLAIDKWYDELDIDGLPAMFGTRRVVSCSNHVSTNIGLAKIKPSPNFQDFNKNADYLNSFFTMDKQSTDFDIAKANKSYDDISKYCKNTPITDFNIDTLVASDNYGASYFARLNSIKKIGNNLEFWITRYKTIPISKSETTRVKTYSQLDLINCRDESKDIQKLVTYEGNGETKEVTVNKDVKLSRVTLDSVAESVVKTVCKIAGD